MARIWFSICRLKDLEYSAGSEVKMVSRYGSKIFCCPVVGVSGCDCYVVGISCKVDEWVGGDGEVREVKVKQGG